MPDILFIPLMTLVFVLVMAGVWRPFMGTFENPTFKVKRFYITLALFLATSAFIMGFLTHNRPQSFIFLIALILILVLSFISTKIQTASPHQQLIISVVALIGIGVNLLIFAGITTDEATKNYFENLGYGTIGALGVALFILFDYVLGRYIVAILAIVLAFIGGELSQEQPLRVILLNISAGFLGAIVMFTLLEEHLARFNWSERFILKGNDPKTSSLRKILEVFLVSMLPPILVGMIGVWVLQPQTFLEKAILFLIWAIGTSMVYVFYTMAMRVRTTGEDIDDDLTPLR